MNALRILPLLALIGCAMQGGASSSMSWRDGAPLRSAWAGHVAAQVRYRRIAGGLELEGVGSDRGWSGFTTGLQLGFAPLPESSRVEFLALAEAGIPIAWSANTGAYGGVTFELPISLEKPQLVTERNRNLIVIGHGAQLAPFVRVRYYPFIGDDKHMLNVGLGVALRVKFSTDLIDLGTR